MYLTLKKSEAKKQQKKAKNKFHTTSSISQLQATEGEIDSFLREIKAVPTDNEIEDFLRTIKALPSEGEINDFLLKIKAQDDNGKPMLYADGGKMSYISPGPSPFARESIENLKKKSEETNIPVS